MSEQATSKQTLEGLPRRTALLCAMLSVSVLLSSCGGGAGQAGTEAPVAQAVDAAASAPAKAAADPGAAATALVDGEEPLLALEEEVPESPIFDGLAAVILAGAETAPAALTTPAELTLVVKASGSLAGGVGPVMQVLVDGAQIGSVEVTATSPTDFTFPAPSLKPLSKVDIVFTNDAVIDGADRNLTVYSMTSGPVVLTPATTSVRYDVGAGAAAFDGKGVIAGQSTMAWSGALRVIWPKTPVADPRAALKFAAVRFLQQATFGPTAAEINALSLTTSSKWIDAQMAAAFKPEFVNFIQAKYARGDSYRPNGGNFDPSWVTQQFLAGAASPVTQLRRRVAFSLHQIFAISLADPNVAPHARAYANYMDTLNKYAFGNYRTILEEIALSPAMGIYLSHMRNPKENPAIGQLPDENFAREVMQLFSIGLYELNQDGSVKVDANGRPIETYGNADVMGLAKVFTGYSWAFPDAELTDAKFFDGVPDYSVAGDKKIDLLRMKTYPGQHSTSEMRFFIGKPNAVTIAAGTSASESLRIALDALTNHPNVGPFIGRQLIQRLVTSNPSAGYVSRVSAKFNNNGVGVRGDMAAVVRAILLDPEARSDPPAGFGKVRDPVLRVTTWMRAFGARSATGQFMMSSEFDPLSMRPMYPGSVFSYYRPGYVPPNTSFSAANVTAPEFQIINESTTAGWINLAYKMAGSGLGWNGKTIDVSSTYVTQVGVAAAGNLYVLLDNVDALLFAGHASQELRTAMLNAALSVSQSGAAGNLNRVRAAVLIALSSPEYIVQR